MVTSLVAAVPIASAAQEQEPNDSRDTAQQIQTGEQVSGEATADDEDWFAFTVQKGETINLTATIGNDDGTVFRIRDPDGDALGYPNTEDGSVTAGATARQTGTYYIEVKNRDGSSDTYDFTVETYTTDSFEPNEERANATSITVGEEVTGEMSIGDTDWFAFTVERGETINLTAAGGPRSDTKFWLKDPDGEFIFSRRSKTGESVTLGTTARQTGTYYVEVTPDGKIGAEYNFTVDTYETDDFESNEERVNATRLYQNPLSSDTADLSLGDLDWFAFDADEDETVTVRAAGGPRSDTKFTLHDPSGGFIASDRSQTGETITLSTTVSSTDTYYVEAQPGGGELGAEYNFTVDVAGERLGLPNDEFERPNPPVGNDDPANATGIDPGTYRDLGMVDDDEDWFRFRAAQDAQVVANVSYDSSTNDLSLELTDASGTTVATGGDGLATNVSETDTYYLRVTGQPEAETTYSLELNVSATGPGALPGQAQAPTDPDGDGLYEDVNGDGTFNILDVSALLGIFDRVGVENVQFLDFNGDGTLNILDVSALLGAT